MASRSAMLSVGLLGQSILRFGTSLAVGRLAGPATLGLVASASALSQLLALLWPSSSATAAAKFLSRAGGHQDPLLLSATITHLRSRAIQSVGALGFLSAIAWQGMYDESGWSAAFVAFLTTSFCLYTFARGVETGLDRNALLATREGVAAAVGLVGVLLIVLMGVRTVLVLLPVALGYFTIACLSWPKGRRVPLSREVQREIDAFTAWATLGTLTSAGMLQLSLLLVRQGGGSVNAGEFAAAVALIAPISLVLAGLTMAFVPIYARGDRLPGDLTDRTTRMISVALLLLCGWGLLLSEDIVRLVWGREFGWTPAVLPYLLTGIFATALAVPSVTSLAGGSTRQMRTATVAGMGGATVGVVVWIAGWSLMDYRIVPLGLTVSAWSVALLCIVVVWRRDHQRWGLLIARVGFAVALLWILADVGLSSSVWLDRLLHLAIFTLCTMAILSRETILWFRYLRDFLPLKRPRCNSAA